MTGLVNHIAIVSESKAITFDDVSTVAAAVSKQVTRDFGPAWGVQATVQAFASLESVPPDYWQVVLVDNDNAPGALGYHTDAHGQPLAVVEVVGNWPITVSHEVIELLADPGASRIVSGPPPKQIGYVRTADGLPPISAMPLVDYLVEVCDPCESEQFSYRIDGVPVSDFVLPSFYGGGYAVHTDFSSRFHDKLVVGFGGYISFRDPATNKWYQIFADGPTVTGQQIPDVSGAMSLREQMDQAARVKRGLAKGRVGVVSHWSAETHAMLHGSVTRASNTRAMIAWLAGKL